MAFTEQGVGMILSPLHYAPCSMPLEKNHTGGGRREKGVSENKKCGVKIDKGQTEIYPVKCKVNLTGA